MCVGVIIPAPMLSTSKSPTAVVPTVPLAMDSKISLSSSRFSQMSGISALI